jgi:hypothetical protein
MPIEVTQAHREQALLACAILPGVEAKRWRLERWDDPILSKIAEAIVAAEARGFEAGVAKERAQTMAWLRGESDHEKEIAASVAFLNGYAREVGKYRPSLGEAVDWALADLAERIEREEHMAITPEHVGAVGGEGSENG